MDCFAALAMTKQPFLEPRHRNERSKKSHVIARSAATWQSILLSILEFCFSKSYLFNISWFCLVSSWLSLLKSRPPASLAWITAIASSCFHSCFFLSILLIVIIIIYLCLSVCPLDYKLLDGRNQILLMFISRMLSHIGDFHYFSFKQEPSSLIAASVSHQQLPLAQLFLDDLPLLQILHF